MERTLRIYPVAAVTLLALRRLGGVYIYVDAATREIMALFPDGRREPFFTGTPPVTVMATSVVTETAFEQAAAVGTSTNAARQDHTHGTPAAQTLASLGAQTEDDDLTAIAALTTLGVLYRVAADTYLTVIPPEKYGSGADGDLDFDGSASVTINGVSHAPVAGVYTLTQDTDGQLVTISDGAVVQCANYKLRGWYLSDGGSTGYVTRNGNNASGTSAGLGFTAGGTLQATSSSGGNGRAPTGVGNGGGSQTLGLGSAGGAGGASGVGQAGGAGGTLTAPGGNQGRAIAGVSLLQGRPIGGTTWGGWGGGSGGGGGGSATAGTSGAGGSGAGFLWAAFFTVDAAGLEFQAIGGNGSNSSASGNNGGGGGGGGGYIELMYSYMINAPTFDVSGGTPGTGFGAGAAGTAGTTGNYDMVQA